MFIPGSTNGFQFAVTPGALHTTNLTATISGNYGSSAVKRDQVRALLRQAPEGGNIKDHVFGSFVLGCAAITFMAFSRIIGEIWVPYFILLLPKEWETAPQAVHISPTIPLPS